MIYVNNTLVNVKKYSDGSLNLDNTEYQDVHQITAYIKNSNDILTLFLLKQKLDFSNTTLHIPYLPYSRSDRKTNTDGVCGIKTIAPLINLLGFKQVKTVQPHSDVSVALINNLVVYYLYDYENPFPNTDYIVTPDAGSMKFGEIASKTYGIPVINTFKIRDTSTNQLTKTIIPDGEQLRGKKILIMDDVCEYGTTFHNLAKVLKEEYGVLEVNLFLAHGVFPLNERVNPPSRFSFVLQYIDNIHCEYIWFNNSLTSPFSSCQADLHFSLPKNVSCSNIFA